MHWPGSFPRVRPQSSPPVQHGAVRGPRERAEMARPSTQLGKCEQTVGSTCLAGQCRTSAEKVRRRRLQSLSMVCRHGIPARDERQSRYQRDLKSRTGGRTWDLASGNTTGLPESDDESDDESSEMQRLHRWSHFRCGPEEKGSGWGRTRRGPGKCIFSSVIPHWFLLFSFFSWGARNKLGRKTPHGSSEDRWSGTATAVIHSALTPSPPYMHDTPYQTFAHEVSHRIYSLAACSGTPVLPQSTSLVCLFRVVSCVRPSVPLTSPATAQHCVVGNLHLEGSFNPVQCFISARLSPLAFGGGFD